MSDPRDGGLTLPATVTNLKGASKVSDPRDDLAALILDKSGLGEWSATQLANTIVAAGWRPPNPCDHSGRATLAPQYRTDPQTFWCQRCGESGLTYPEGYTYPDNKPRQEIPR